MHRVTFDRDDTILHELSFELLLLLPNFPDLAPSDYHLFTNLKGMLAKKKYGSNAGVICAHFSIKRQRNARTAHE